MFLLSTVLKGKNPILQFVLFALSGALVEYVSSYFQYAVFGTRSWDYSDRFMNINGRVDLRMTVVWGILGIIVARLLYPYIVRLLQKMNGKFWTVSCFALSVFMAVNLAVSAAAVMRWKVRVTEQTPPANAFESFLDVHFDNDKMKKVYSNMKFIK